jgi:ERCC4-type nuclease
MSQYNYSKLVNVKMRIDSPKIILDSENSVFLIEGPSYPEDPFEVYNCVIHWITMNNNQFDKPLVCEFKFKVLSSASRKLILEILLKLEKASKKNRNVKIKWYYEKYDEDMKEAGEDLSDNIDIPFEFECL